MNRKTQGGGCGREKELPLFSLPSSFRATLHHLNAWNKLAFSSFSFTLSPYPTPSCVFPASPYPTPSCFSPAFLRRPDYLNSWNRLGKGLRTRLHQVVRTWEHNYNLEQAFPGRSSPLPSPTPVPLGTPGELARRQGNITITAFVDKTIIM